MREEREKRDEEREGIIIAIFIIHKAIVDNAYYSKCIVNTYHMFILLSTYD
uniref:Uncharacterized protein n=1 Tax=Solanum lycopersicum TaxID=4081 RepID=A0A3Q7FX63_SOLLC